MIPSRDTLICTILVVVQSEEREISRRPMYKRKAHQTYIERNNQQLLAVTFSVELCGLDSRKSIPVPASYASYHPGKQLRQKVYAFLPNPASPNRSNELEFEAMNDS